MSDAVRDFDWAQTALGPSQAWPTSLRIAVDMLLASKFPGCLVWGSEMITLHNDGFVPLLGAKPASLGKPLNVIWSDVWDDICGLARRAYTGEAVFMENFLLNTDRNGVMEQAYFTFCYSPVRDESGQVAGFLNTVFETTSSVRNEQQWRERADAFEQQILEQTADHARIWALSSDIMLLVREDLQIYALNPSGHTLLGWDDAVVGRSIFDFLHAEDLSVVDAILMQLRNGQTVQGVESRLRHRDGHYRWFSWSVVPSAGIYTAIGHDVTLDRERAAALLQAEELLRQSQKMDAVGQLTAGVAHDFNNLLTGISGSLEMIERRIGQGQYDNLDRYILAAKEASQRAAVLTHRLLAFARRQPLDPRPANLNTLIHGIDALIRQTVGPDIAMQLQVDPQLWGVLVDANQLENAVLNLCINARDAMPAGGCLKISTSNERYDASLPGKDGLPPGDYCSLSVEDNGSGMRAEVATRAFEPFFTTKPAGQGTGLGLSMVYGFVRQSGGRVWIESPQSGGTRINLVLPRYAGCSSDPLLPSPQQRQAGPLAKGCIVLIDDEPTLRLLLKEVLQQEGYEVVEAVDGSSGLAACQALERIDLLITDIGLPGGFSGRQVASALRQQRPEQKVLFITGYTDVAITQHDTLEDGVALLTKPFALDVLLQRVKGMLQGEALRVSPADVRVP
ncbi:ATP-binding protein [Pseudomonas aegrilactucae]|uniref:histidine kinase n=1 Tax=Pseudomonas aegrilactucae TaxID=2854028 RepID=A0A9Q3AFB7_9PSED|nr:ATP-binding protein [Pseudomonas aegrilactucae]MBV6288290.1 response regulator [Pseudomonas aegrilactucae]